MTQDPPLKGEGETEDGGEEKKVEGYGGRKGGRGNPDRPPMFNTFRRAWVVDCRL